MKGARHSLSDIEKAFVEAALAAGRGIMSRFKDRLPAMLKADGSPVTDADLRAEAAIRARLGEALPHLPIIGEEGEAPGAEMASPDGFILVDPLDGTRDFLAGSAEFTVNIALIDKGRPIIGVVHAPALGRLFIGSVGGGAWRNRGERRSARRRDGRATGSAGARSPGLRSARLGKPLASEPVTEALLAKLGPSGRRSVGSSLKFALVAAGEGDLYARGVSLNESDIAAGDAVLSAAGGAPW